MEEPDNKSSQRDLADYKQLSKQQLNQRLDALLSTPANEQKNDEAQFLLHELQVHQIELEIQNLELREAQGRLEEARDRYSDLYDFSPMGYLTLDRKGIILNINLMAATMLGAERGRLVGLPFATKFAAGEQRVFFNLLNKVFDSLKKQSLELHLKQPNNHFMAVRLECISAKEFDDEATTCNCAIIDITERKLAEQALQESESNLIIGQKISNMGNWKFYPETGQVECSDELLRIFGLTRDGNMSLDTFADVVHPEDREYDLAHIQKGIEHGTPWNIEHRLLLKDGTIKWVHAVGKAELNSNGKTDQIIGIVQDVSDRKRAEEKTLALLQQNRELTQRLFQMQEQERQHLARELHDEFAQWLTVLRIHTHLLDKCNSNSDVNIDDSIKVIDDVSSKMHQGIRSMIHQLRPAELDELGLKDSLQELVDNWQKHYPQTHCALRLEGNLNGFNETLNVTVYRVIQESLTNVAKYSMANNVSILLRHNATNKDDADFLLLTIDDDGKGTDLGKSTNGFGLAGMRERVLAAGGEFILESSPGAGVHIEARLPVTTL